MTVLHEAIHFLKWILGSHGLAKEFTKTVGERKDLLGHH
jgi:hypothetical protein